MAYVKKKDIFQNFLHDIETLSLKNNRILVGVSGGQDSSVLLHLSSMLPKKFHVFGLYINHNLRNSAIAEEKFVINKLKIYHKIIFLNIFQTLGILFFLHAFLCFDCLALQLAI